MEDFSNKFLEQKGFQNIQFLGKGAISLVLKAYNSKTNKFVAIKRITKSTQSGKENQYEQKEIQIITLLYEQMKKQYCQFITEVYDIFQDEDSTYVVSEFCQHGDLFNYQSQFHPFFTLFIIAQMLLQLIIAIEFLHNLSIIHRDLKPENILVTEINNALFLKLTDFGISTHQDLTKSQVGTVTYMAPEILRNQQYDKSVDIWSFGCIAYEIIFNKQLFSADSQLGVCRKILAFTSYNEGFDQFSDIIKSCLQVEPNQRATAKQIRQKLENYIIQLTNQQNEMTRNQQFEEQKIQDNEISYQMQSNNNSPQNQDLENQRLLSSQQEQVKSQKSTLQKKNSTLQKYITITSIEHEGLDISSVKQTKSRPQEPNFLQYCLEFNEGKEIVEQNNFKKGTSSYLLYQSDLDSTSNDEDDKHSIIIFVSVLLQIIIKEDINLLKQFFQKLDLVRSNQQEQQRQIIQYAIQNSIYVEQNTKRRIQYLIKDVLRIQIIQQTIRNVCSDKKNEIKLLPYELNLDLHFLKKKLYKHIPRNKLYQFLWFTKSILWNRVAFISYATLGFIGISYYYFQFKQMNQNQPLNTVITSFILRKGTEENNINSKMET